MTFAKGENFKHGHAGNGRAGRSPTYHSWQSMIARCTRKGHPRFEHYGGRGIQVDPTWTGPGGFAQFLADVGERPADKTLDRIDVNGHYTPGNVRWATLVEQRWNRRDMVEHAVPVDDEWKVEPLFAVPDLAPDDDEIPF